jgi:hypothetical protein
MASWSDLIDMAQSSCSVRRDHNASDARQVSHWGSKQGTSRHIPIGVIRHHVGARLTAAAWLVSAGEAPRLHDPTEAVDGPLDLLVGVLDELGDQLAGLAWRVVLERHLNVGGAAAAFEADRAGVADVGVPDAAPGDPLVGDVLGDLGVPLDLTCPAAPRPSSGWSWGR